VGGSDGNHSESRRDAGAPHTEDMPTGDDPPTVSERRRPSIDDATPGEVIGGRYELIDEIGRGAFGQVFRARDRVTESVVALKVFARRQSADSIKRLRREVQIAHRVTHPGVVRIHDLVEGDGRLCVSMEYVEGETLAERLRKWSQLPAQEVAQIATDLARALAAAHRVGVVHRDLKPANIILRASNGRAVIVDFGISRQLEDLSSDDAITRDGQAIGTPRYMPPEQLLAREIGPPADLYAWALVVYEASTGRVPHQGKTATQLAVERVDSAPPDLTLDRRDLPPALCRAVEQCLSPDPARRYADGDALRAALQLSSTSTELTAARPRKRRRRMLRRLAVAVLLVAGAAAAGGATWWWRGGAIPPHDRCIVVEVRNAGGGDDGWIAGPLLRMAVRKLGEREPRVRVVDDVAQANVAVQLTFRRTPEGVSVDCAAGPARGRRTHLVSVAAPSIAAAADQLVDAVYRRFAADQPLRAPDPDEQRDMDRLGARSFTAYWRYRVALDVDFSAVLIDAEASDRAMQEVIARDPGWAHAWVSLVDGRGIASARGQETLAQARKALASSTQDPVGQKMLAAQSLAAEGRLTEAALLLDPEYRAHPDDLYLGWILARRVFHPAGRTQDALAVFQRLYDLRPDLQFGANLIDELRRVGRGREVAALVHAWLARAPESEDARAAQVLSDLEAGQLADAVRHAREQVFVQGEAPHRLATLADVLIVAGQHAEASRLAETMLRGSGPIRSRGWVRLGIIATLEGRFSTALEAYASAVAEGKAYPWQSGLRIAYESARWLAAVLGHTAEAERYDLELIEFYRRSGMAWQAAAVDFDRKLLRGKKAGCPSRDAALAEVPDGPGRNLARVAMLRSAAAVGCASCADVLREGFLADEWNQQGLYRFGVCAKQEGALGQARDAFDRVRSQRHSSIDVGVAPSEVFAVLARYQLGSVLEKMGDTHGARVAFEDFLAHWGHADRSLPEIEDARRALARLH
jgi:tetratricopeptide (TPR) repeat protein